MLKYLLYDPFHKTVFKGYFSEQPIPTLAKTRQPMFEMFEVVTLLESPQTGDPTWIQQIK